ncbi:MAG: hypothetical protein Q7S73_00215 [bacterium]|nr:hypothetical protein [bacterium]
MNLKNLILPMLLILSLAGCEEEPIDDILMNKIWLEAITLIQIPPATPIPEIKFLEECPDIGKCKKEKFKDLDNCPHKNPDILGTWHDSIIRICLNNIYENNWSHDKYYAYYHIHFSYKHKRAMFYGTVAHEMLHHALFLKGRSNNHEHQLMKDEKLIEKMMDLISDHLKLPKDGIQKEPPLRSLDRGIKLDKEKAEKD